MASLNMGSISGRWVKNSSNFTLILRPVCASPGIRATARCGDRMPPMYSLSSLRICARLC
eukprot:2950235-Amphidinium_carterae.1